LVGLNTVVAVLLNAVERPLEQLIEDRRVNRGSVGRHLDGSRSVGQRRVEESPCRLGVTALTA
jgi:hypothetical protein